MVNVTKRVVKPVKRLVWKTVMKPETRKQTKIIKVLKVVKKTRKVMRAVRKDVRKTRLIRTTQLR
jgi:hypothetical protein